MTRPNGVNTNYAYDSLSRLLSVLHQLSGNTIDGATYTVDPVGNRTSKLNHLNAVTENYTYDAIYQLTQVVQGMNTTESYTYDQVGNRLSSLGVSPYTYNSSNELTATPNATFTYDNNGNTLSKTDAQGTTSYGWDFENRLTAVTLPDQSVVSFSYDPFGRRIRKATSQGTTIYLYDGGSLIQELDGAGIIIARHTQGLGFDEPLAVLQGASNHFYHSDGLRSVTSLSDSAGTVSISYTHDSLGNSTTSGSIQHNPFRFTAREYDDEIFLYYYRARYFDPRIGRFLNEDPGGFRGQDSNLYRYVRNNPVRFIDPAGLLLIDPDFDQNCKRDLQRALNIVERLTKDPRCNCRFRKIGDGRSLQELLDSPIAVHSAPPSPMREVAFTEEGNKDEIWIRPYGCRMGRWMLAAGLIHELVHISMGPADTDEQHAMGWDFATECGVFNPSTLMGPQTITVTGN